MTPKPTKRFVGPLADKVEQLSGLDDTIRDFYDVFMAAVEPDLMTKNIGQIDEKYPNESEQSRKERAERYAQAYSLFLIAFTHAVEQWQADLDFYAKSAIAQTKQKTEAKEQRKLSRLERFLDKAA